MIPTNPTELIKTYGEYVALLEKELATNVTFLNATTRDADAVKAKEYTDKIATLKAA